MNIRAMGSSPLSRGIPRQRCIHQQPLRIIPALAGNTTPARYAHSSWPDHPRSRGEYSCPSQHPEGRLGSSPLSRGIQRYIVADNDEARIIPALAGNTKALGFVLIHRRDHPRSRGEYVDRWNDRVKVYGSSPLSRGIPVVRPSQFLLSGIIPALAGNTVFVLFSPIATTDHPRSRGEYRASGGSIGVPPGSSPLSRGILRPSCARP